MITLSLARPHLPLGDKSLLWTCRHLVHFAFSRRSPVLRLRGTPRNQESRLPFRSSFATTRRQTALGGPELAQDTKTCSPTIHLVCEKDVFDSFEPLFSPCRSVSGRQPALRWPEIGSLHWACSLRQLTSCSTDLPRLLCLSNEVLCTMFGSSRVNDVPSAKCDAVQALRRGCASDQHGVHIVTTNKPRSEQQ
jgi:hypothetical protein